MATHEVTFQIPARPLGREDIEFVVRRDGEMLGTLKISNGSIVWFPKFTNKGYRMNWVEFDKLMKEHAPESESR